MSLSTDRDPEKARYHNWLLRIQDYQLQHEILEIVSIFIHIFFSYWTLGFFYMKILNS